MYRHIYDYNIVNCGVKPQIYLTLPNLMAKDVNLRFSIQPTLLSFPPFILLQVDIGRVILLQL